MNCFPWNAPCFQMPCVQVLTPVRVRLSTSENGPRWGNDTSCSILKQNGILRTLTFKSRLKCGDLSTTGTGSFGATTPPIKRTSTPTVSAILQARSGESRRAVLQGALAGVVAGIVLVAQPAGAQLALKSRTCDTPCTLTIQNGAINQFLDVYWLNYDGAQISDDHTDRTCALMSWTTVVPDLCSSICIVQGSPAQKACENLTPVLLFEKHQIISRCNHVSLHCAQQFVTGFISLTLKEKSSRDLFHTHAAGYVRATTGVLSWRSSSFERVDGIKGWVQGMRSCLQPFLQEVCTLSKRSRCTPRSTGLERKRERRERGGAVGCTPICGTHESDAGILAWG